MQLNALVKDD